MGVATVGGESQQTYLCPTIIMYTVHLSDVYTVHSYIYIASSVRCVYCA